MKRLFFGIGALLVVAGSAQASSNVSGRYDGRYDGSAVPVAGMGPASCTGFSLATISIEKGILKVPRGGAGIAISGFITEEGYVSAFMTRAGHERSALDGRLQDDLIVAGFIEKDTGCVWTVHLARQR
jgi:hypothetical protein